MKRPACLGLLALLLPSAALAQTTTEGTWGPPPAPQTAPPPGPFAAPPPPAPQGDSLMMVPRAQHALYVSGTSLLLLNAASVNYSYRPLRVFAVSIGGGISNAFGFFTEVSAVGGQVMVHGLFGGASAHSFEAAGGVSVIDTNATLFCSGCTSARRVEAMPAAFLGYRYHPLDGGFFFRGGAAWDLGLGIGASVSFGAAF